MIKRLLKNPGWIIGAGIAIFAALVMFSPFLHAQGSGQFGGGGGGATSFPLQAPNGTASAPNAYSFANCTNCGLYYDGTQVALSMGGSGFLSIVSGQGRAFFNGAQIALGGNGLPQGQFVSSTTLTHGLYNDTVASHPIHNAEVGTCSMSTTTCTFATSATYTTGVCWASEQTNTGNTSKCTVSGGTATVTAGVSNTDTWTVLVMGNPN